MKFFFQKSKVFDLKFEKDFINEGKFESKRVEEVKKPTSIKKIGKNIELIYRERSKTNTKKNDKYTQFLHNHHFDKRTRMPLSKILQKD